MIYNVKMFLNKYIDWTRVGMRRDFVLLSFKSIYSLLYKYVLIFFEELDTKRLILVGYIPALVS